VQEKSHFVFSSQAKASLPQSAMKVVEAKRYDSNAGKNDDYDDFGTRSVTTEFKKDLFGL
jgi:hypothetical protein